MGADPEKVQVTIDIAGLRKAGEGRNRILLVSPSLEKALQEVREYLASGNTRINYTVYFNGTFVTRSGVKSSGKRVQPGDVFKAIPIMGGG